MYYWCVKFGYVVCLKDFFKTQKRKVLQMNNTTQERSLYYDATGDLIINDTPDFFGSQDIYDEVVEALYDYDPADLFESMPVAFNKALNILKTHDPETYAQYEPSIRMELYSILHDWLEELAEEQMSHRWEYNNLTTHQFIEDLQKPFRALELLDELYVDSYIPRTFN